jgi:hypothetical protein
MHFLCYCFEKTIQFSTEKIVLHHEQSQQQSYRKLEVIMPNIKFTDYKYFNFTQCHKHLLTNNCERLFIQKHQNLKHV